MSVNKPRIRKVLCKTDMLRVPRKSRHDRRRPGPVFPPILIKIAPWVTGITNAEGMTPSCGTLSHYYVFMSNTLSTEKLKAAAAKAPPEPVK